MEKRWIGLEVGGETLKLAVYGGGRVLQMVSEPLPQNVVTEGKLSAPQVLADQLARLRKAHSLPKGPCALVLPRQVVLTRTLSLPLLTAQELELNLPLEFCGLADNDRAAYRYDYAVLRTGEHRMEIFAAATRRDCISQYAALLKKAGFALKIALPAEMAWQNLVRHGTALPADLCLVDAGADGTGVYFFRQGRYAMGRTLPLGGRFLDELLAAQTGLDLPTVRLHKTINHNDLLHSAEATAFFQQLAREIFKMVLYYSEAVPDSNLRHICFCGGMANIGRLRSAVEQLTDLTPLSASSLLPCAAIDEGASRLCAAAVGAAIQASPQEEDAPWL